MTNLKDKVLICRLCGSSQVSVEHSSDSYMIDCLNCPNWEASSNETDTSRFKVKEEPSIECESSTPKIFNILGTYAEGFESRFVNLNVVAMDASSAIRSYIDNFHYSEDLKYDDCTDFDEGTISTLNIEEIDIGSYDEEIEWDYTIPIYEDYCTHGVGNAEEVLRTLTEYDSSLPRVRRAYLQRGDKSLYIIHDFGSANESSRKAIADCVRKGIDPFGY